MKKAFFKIFVSFLSLLLFSFSNVFAGECSSSCRIKDETAQILADYFVNNHKVISNISKQLKNKDKKPWYYLQKENAKIQNLIFNWNDTLTSWEYFTSQISAEIPAPIERDLRKLKNEGENLNKFLKRVLEEGYSGNNIINICDGVDFCKLENGQNASDIIGELVANNARIIDLYKLNVLGKWMSFSGKGKIILVPKNFESEMNNFYNKYSVLDCTNCEGAFGDRIKKSFKKFLLNTKNGEDGFAKWTEAWNLLRDSHSNSAEIQKIEAKLLKEELSRQGVSSSNASAMLKNLEEFNNNSWGAYPGNNPISNTFETLVNSLDVTGMKKVFSNFGQTVANIYAEQTDTSRVSIRTFSSVKDEVGESNNIMQEIDLLFQKQIPFISGNNLNSEKFRAKIIKMHENLTNAINILDKSIPNAIRVCDSQDKGAGKCNEF